MIATLNADFIRGPCGSRPRWGRLPGPACPSTIMHALLYHLFPQDAKEAHPTRHSSGILHALFCGVLWLCGLLLVWPYTTAATEAPSAPLRVVSLAPSLTELLFAMDLGDTLIGRSSACDYPAAARDLPSVGGFGRPNPEMLHRLRPDLVITTDLEKPGLRRQLERQGATVRVLPCESWAELRAAARELGALLNASAQADRWVQQMETRIERLQARSSRRPLDERPKVYVEVWGNPVMTVGKDAFLNEVIAWAGGRNVAADVAGRYPTISGEWVVREDPDVILVAYMLADLPAAQAIRRRLGWSGIAGLRENRMVDDVDPDWLLRPGPRLLDGAEALADRIDHWWP